MKNESNLPEGMVELKVNAAKIADLCSQYPDKGVFDTVDYWYDLQEAVDKVGEYSMWHRKLHDEVHGLVTVEDHAFLSHDPSARCARCGKYRHLHKKEEVVVGNNCKECGNWAQYDGHKESCSSHPTYQLRKRIEELKKQIIDQNIELVDKEGTTAMKYRVLSEASAPDLESTVQRHVDKGWVPVGGVAISVTGEKMARTWTYLQAVVLKEGEGGKVL